MLALIAGAVVFSFADISVIDLGAVHLLAEATLVLVLFHDAATVRLSGLVQDLGLPVRLLALGFPLAVAATFGAAWSLFPALGAMGALLLAASVTPTDAGLGVATVLNPAVPIRVRRALNVESGLNDGLATPIVLLALSGLATATIPESERAFLSFGVVPVTVALVLAVIVAWGGAWLTEQSAQRAWSNGEGRQIIMLMIPLLLLGGAEVLGGNAFIAAFVGGLVFGARTPVLHDEPETSWLLETGADLLSLGVWFLGGGLMLVVFEAGVRWQWIVMAVAALTVLRLVPVWLCLLGTGFRLPTIAFLGWFGPRGLASIIFAILTVEELGDTNPVMIDVVGTIAVSVLLSVIVHGLSAGPLAARYGSWVRRTHPPIEKEPASAPARPRGGLTGQRAG